jgi:hypothetical protein
MSFNGHGRFCAFPALFWRRFSMVLIFTGFSGFDDMLIPFLGSIVELVQLGVVRCHVAFMLMALASCGILP